MFEHDFNHTDYDVTEFDERAGTPGLHTVRGTVKADPRETLLPPDLFNRSATTPSGAIRRTFPPGCKSCEVSSSISATSGVALGATPEHQDRNRERCTSHETGGARLVGPALARATW